MKKLNTEEFIQKAIIVHGNKYNYDKVVYKNNSTKVCIICPIHGEFWQKPSYHLHGSGCPKCKSKKIGERNKIICTLPLEEILIKFKKIHNDKYDYSLINDTNYSNTKIKIPILCHEIGIDNKEHGLFMQRPIDHISGSGCTLCYLKQLKKSKEQFISDCNIIFGVNRYDYSKLFYNGATKKIIIICHEKDKNGQEHGEFIISASAHLNKQHCPKCEKEKFNKLHKKSIEQLIIDFNKIHNNKYEYSLINEHNYINAQCKIPIICHEKDENGKEHGIFNQTANHHLKNHGCPKCHLFNNKGKNHPAWNHDLTDQERYSTHHRSIIPGYDIAMRVAKERDGKCIICHSVENLHGHHINDCKHYPELRCDPNNIITLCFNHHIGKNGIHHIYGSFPTKENYEEFLKLNSI